MMKRTLTVFLFTIICMPVFGGILDDNKITAGEYGYFITWRSFNPPLIVDGGGAEEIQVRDNGRLIVQSTSKPLNMDDSGVYDILLYNTAHLEYLNGVTELIRIGNNATAVLKGGSINLINSMQFTNKTGADPHIDLYCRLDSWSWINNDPFAGIQGLWLDGSPFYIQFSNDSTYDPVWTNINIIPEPASLLLLGLGGFLLRRKK